MKPWEVNDTGFTIITVEDAYKALVKNGFEHIRKEWVSTNPDGTILGGCAIGQMAINLGVAPIGDGKHTPMMYTLHSQLNHFMVPYSKLRGRVRYNYDGYAALGDLIITLNDMSGNMGFVYKWKDLVRAVHYYMKPFFNEQITLSVVTFKLPTSMQEVTK